MSRSRATKSSPEFKRLLRILASAGSGKTYRLTGRYLQLIAGDIPPERVFAGTFTRLASGEIRDRILVRLAGAVDDEKARRELSEAVGRELSRSGVLKLLRDLTSRIHRMQVRTLDGLFASITQVFAHELGLPAGCTLMDETGEEQLRREVMRLMLEEGEPQRLINLLRLMTMGTADRSVMTAIEKAVKNMGGLAEEAPDTAWECIPILPGRLNPGDLVEAIQFMQENGPDEESDSRQIKAHQDDCGRALNRDWETFLDKGLVNAIRNNEGKYYKKGIAPEVVAAYERVIQHAEAELAGRWQDQTIATRDLLLLYRTQEEQLKRRRRVLSFADLTRCVPEAEKRGSLEEICYRLDATLHHLLLDEFQDTSVAQWRALAPIVRELAADETAERSFFCVGDVKQSIYGWREAAPEILERLPALVFPGGGEEQLEEETLSKSYRSAPEIMDFVNDLFGSLAGNDALRQYQDSLEGWGEFPKHETAKKKIPGFVQVRMVEQEGNQDIRDAERFRQAADQVSELAENDAGQTIGVLVRKNKSVARLLFELDQRGLTASGKGGRPLTDTGPVNAILDLLTLADHPAHTVGAFHVAGSPLAETVATGDFRGRNFRGLGQRVRRQIMEDGYGKTLAGWVQAIAPACSDWERMRLMQLAELGGGFDANSASSGLRMGDFIRQIEQKRVPLPTAARVQVMTVHQAKGLEFDLVVLPELEARLSGAGTPAVVFEREEVVGEIRTICRHAKKNIRALVPEMEEVFQKHKERTVRESLSGLYVAVTRAKRGLWLLIDAPKENEKTIPQTLAGVMRCALMDDPRAEVTGGIVYKRGDFSGLETGRREITATDLDNEQEERTIEFASGEKSDGFAGEHESPSASEEAWFDPFALPNERARRRGTVIHALFEQVEWLEAGTPNEEMLVCIARRHAPREDDSWIEERVVEFLKMLEQPAIRTVLSRGKRAADRVRVWREHPFARLVQGKVQRGFIDRLEAEYDESGQVIAARVIDFKTDKLTETPWTEHAERYREQLGAYRSVAAEMLGRAEERVGMTVLFVEEGEAVELG